MKAKTLFKWVFVGIAVWILLLMIGGFTYGFVDSYKETSTSTPTVSPSLVQSEIQSEQTGTAKSVYMSSCDTDGTMTAYCSCTYDYLISRYSIADIAKMGDYYEQNGDLTNEMWAAVEACL